MARNNPLGTETRLHLQWPSKTQLFFHTCFELTTSTILLSCEGDCFHQPGGHLGPSLAPLGSPRQEDRVPHAERGGQGPGICTKSRCTLSDAEKKAISARCFGAQTCQEGEVCIHPSSVLTCAASGAFVERRPIFRFGRQVSHGANSR